ncbi:MipA/OmpV family protein [Thalassotalea agarivorans]|uniref:Outer membrane scaffolding protein for murein synthesis, MipA/OmpV family n=1 Tax=Thalassotalea agarivorans TaxID=349064 RepID=A0A1I0CXE6_THASX|nr:MipA/OmpV family protein [Thalassotalea agarivorans]SET24533.1 Outer membrane scaffolding protein for murein synthesis, MipA/OmpV family [Thalassotalea agarivorans]
MKHFFALCAILCTCLASATSQIEANNGEFVISAGYGNITNPVKDRDDITFYGLPEFVYYGERFYIENTTVGYALLENEHWMVDAYAFLNEDGFFYQLDGTKALSIPGAIGNSYRQPTRRDPLPDVATLERNASYLAGFNVSNVTQWYTMQLGWGKDVSGVHHGDEVTFQLFNRYIYHRFTFAWNVGARYKSAKINDYYYTVHEDEWAIPMRSPSIGETITPWVKVAAHYYFDQHWSVGFTVQQNWLDAKLKRGYIVDETNYTSVFVGLSYKF